MIEVLGASCGTDLCLDSPWASCESVVYNKRGAMAVFVWHLRASERVPFLRRDPW